MIKKTILIFLLVLGLSMNVWGWTAHPFHAEKLSGEWTVTTFTDELRNKYLPKWKAGEVFAVSILYKEGGPPRIVLVQRNVPEDVVVSVSSKLFAMVSILKREIPKLKIIALTYYYPLKEVSSHLGLEDRKNEELHKKVAKVLNDAREKRIGI